MTTFSFITPSCDVIGQYMLCSDWSILTQYLLVQCLLTPLVVRATQQQGLDLLKLGGMDPGGELYVTRSVAEVSNQLAYATVSCNVSIVSCYVSIFLIGQYLQEAGLLGLEYLKVSGNTFPCPGLQ